MRISASPLAHALPFGPGSETSHDRKGVVSRISLIAALVASAAFAATAQEAAPAVEFEAASVKPSPPERGFQFGCRTPDPSLFVCNRTSLRLLVMRAYGVERYRVDGPAWMDTGNFEINAKVPAGATRAEINVMLQHLLASRFGLAVHRETRDVPAFALTVGKSGPKFKESLAGTEPAAPPTRPLSAEPTDGAGAAPVQPHPTLVIRTPGAAGIPGTIRRTYSPGGYWLDAARVRIYDLLPLLQSEAGRHIEDETGLKGIYDFALHYAHNETAEDATATPDLAPSIFTAVQDQMGLKLEPKKVPTEMLVVDHAEKVPNAN